MSHNKRHMVTSTPVSNIREREREKRDISYTILLKANYWSNTQTTIKRTAHNATVSDVTIAHKIKITGVWNGLRKRLASGFTWIAASSLIDVRTAPLDLRSLDFSLEPRSTTELFIIMYATQDFLYTSEWTIHNVQYNHVQNSKGKGSLFFFLQVCTKSLNICSDENDGTFRLGSINFFTA